MCLINDGRDYGGDGERIGGVPPCRKDSQAGGRVPKFHQGGRRRGAAGLKGPSP